MRAAILALSAFAAASYAGSTLKIEARQASQVCYAGAYIIVARGTFEQQDITGFGLQGGLVDALLNAIPNSNASSVIYPASVIDYGTSVQQGAVNTQKQIVDYNSACPDGKIILLGYSQGAQVIGNALAGGGSGIPVLGGNTGANPSLPPSIGAAIVGLNLLGDPNRARGQGVDSDPDSCQTSSSTPRTGSIFDAFQSYSNRLETWCHDGDPVCCSNGDDPGSHLGYLLSQDNVNQMVQFLVARYHTGPLNS